MGHRGFGRQWASHPDQQMHQHGRRGGWGGPPWGGFGSQGFGRPGNPGPPPWVAGLFGLAQGDRQRGPRVRRGDVRSAILDVLRGAQESGAEVNGYQVIQQITERSNGAWRPSPGSVYPTVSQLEDEGLVATTETGGRRSLGLTAAGEEYVAAHADELAGVWAPFEEPARDEEGGVADLRPEIGQVMGAVWQIVTTGSDRQRQAAIEILVETRRRLYGVLADGDEEPEDEPADQEPGDQEPGDQGPGDQQAGDE
ncbi:PadR family transcriptional regulator [Nocardioides sp.]|uniref:PadR family transcriptional regulator n=1 Tax=Nocardioides sp. TaxID=35761 RepID=UPI003785084B